LQDVVIPSGLEPFASDQTFFHGSVLLENREREPPKVGCNVGPITAEMLGDSLRAGRPTADEEQGLV
jgi:hypothetical protein